MPTRFQKTMSILESHFYDGKLMAMILDRKGSKMDENYPS